MDKELFVRDLLSDPERAIDMYRDGEHHDAELDALIKQATHLEERIHAALKVPVPDALAQRLIEASAADKRDRLVFERALMTEPAVALAQLEQDNQASAEKQLAGAKAEAFEGRLGQALGVSAPADMARSIAEHVQREGSARKPRAWVTAVAASVFAVVGVALILSPRESEAAKLQQAFSEHIIHKEPRALTSFEAVDEPRVAALFKDFDAEASTSFGEVHYARKCPIGDSRGVHIVMQQPDGPVTLLFLPRKSLAQVQNFELDGGISGRMFPMANGVGALFGHKGQTLESLDREISSAFVRAVAATAGTRITGQG